MPIYSTLLTSSPLFFLSLSFSPILDNSYTTPPKPIVLPSFNNTSQSHIAPSQLFLFIFLSIYIQATSQYFPHSVWLVQYHLDSLSLPHPYLHSISLPLSLTHSITCYYSLSVTHILSIKWLLIQRPTSNLHLLCDICLFDLTTSNYTVPSTTPCHSFLLSHYSSHSHPTIPLTPHHFFSLNQLTSFNNLLTQQSIFLITHLIYHSPVAHPYNLLKPFYSL